RASARERADRDARGRCAAPRAGRNGVEPRDDRHRRAARSSARDRRTRASRGAKPREHRRGTGGGVRLPGRVSRWPAPLPRFDTSRSMNRFLHTTLLLFRIHLARSFLTRRTMLCSALMLLPGAIAWTLARFSTRIGGDDIAAHLGWLLMLQTLVPLVALVV